MTNAMLVRVITATLAKMRDPMAAEKAEAIAERIQIIEEALGGEAAPGSPGAPPVQLAPVSFPSYNPEAVAPVAEPEPMAPAYNPADAGNLIVPATTVPDKVTRIEAPLGGAVEPVRSLRKPAAGRMRVEDLNLLIQQRTPTMLEFDVPMEDGSIRRMTFNRDVLSRHAYDSVQLVYFPPGTPQNAREAVQVQASIHLDDLPVDLPAMLTHLRQEAIASVRPKPQIMSMPPAAPPGPATSLSPKNVQANQSVVTQVQGTFDASASIAAAPPMHGPDWIPSQYH